MQPSCPFSTHNLEWLSEKESRIISYLCWNPPKTKLEVTPLLFVHPYPWSLNLLLGCWHPSTFTSSRPMYSHSGLLPDNLFSLVLVFLSSLSLIPNTPTYLITFPCYYLTCSTLVAQMYQVTSFLYLPPCSFPVGSTILLIPWGRDLV